ncbi:unnamed protein product [Plutella xylostella]|uniref:(diamondback moth) hypothetical protein n=1 Tax=Plutella xylostella TaxID=51655 RepID=A0A8S4E9Z2_PLUXY|nr:unnamed protein product [Plutella xylostella]
MSSDARLSFSNAARRPASIAIAAFTGCSRLYEIESRFPRVPGLSCTFDIVGGGRMQLFSIIVGAHRCGMDYAAFHHHQRPGGLPGVMGCRDQVLA